MRLLNINPEKEGSACRKKTGFSCGAMYAMPGAIFTPRAGMADVVVGVTK
jgi:hypothetical protein